MVTETEDRRAPHGAAGGGDPPAGERTERSDEVLRRAEAELGFRLRGPQREAVEAVLAGRDTLAVLPTGAGKSAIYQVAGSGLPGCTVVVSPLLALQHDQMASIGTRFGGAAALNSLLRTAERRTVLDRARAGQLEFVFVSPEMLADDGVLAALGAARPSLVVVDEAHCISSWGHDFRPDYLALRTAVRTLGRPPILALTASAAPPTRQEIVDQLGMDDPFVILSSFERRRIHLAVRRLVDRPTAEAEVVRTAAAIEGRGLVYVARRADAERLAATLSAHGVPAMAYHAGLARARRDVVLHRFRDDPQMSVVATNAFGMGIDVPDVRFVLHVEPPESLDAYYQELGRAGRDEQPAWAVCCAVTAQSSRRRAGVSRLDPDVVHQVFDAIADGAGSRAKVATAVGLSRRRLHQVLADLEAIGAVRTTGRRIRATAASIDPADLDELHASRAALTDSRAGMLRRYLEGDQCRWHQLLAYFGEASPSSCGHCDACENRGTGEARRPRQDPLDGAAMFAVDEPVSHPHFGAGVVVDHDADTVTVLFAERGYRVIDAELAAGGLLTRRRSA